MRSSQIGCPDIRRETIEKMWPPKAEDKRKVRGMGPTLHQLLKEPEVTQVALAAYLAIVKSNYEALGGVDTYRIHKTIAARVTTAW
jgi:hypothetical protein